MGVGDFDWQEFRTPFAPRSFPSLVSAFLINPREGRDSARTEGERVARREGAERSTICLSQLFVMIFLTTLEKIR